MKHTPAPWQTDRRDKATVVILGIEPQFATQYSSGRIRIAEVFENASDESNTRLIAAAPNMAEELTNALILLYMVQDGQTIPPAELQNRVDAISEILYRVKG